MRRELETTLVTDLLEAAQPVSERELLGTLTLLNGSRAGLSYTVSEDEACLGRDPEADIVLEDVRCSRRHARLLHSEGSYAIEDLGSSNGSWVDGHRVQGLQPLRDGARLQLGSSLLRFDLRDPVEQGVARRMYESSVRDGLTGLYNRRHFDERLASEFAFALRHGTPLSLLLVDIDHFKKINDTYGHPAGDAVLRAVAGALGDAMRTEDFLARYGGEELVVLVRGIDGDGTHRLAERARRVVEELRIPTAQGLLSCHISVGYSHNQLGPLPAGRDALLAEADRALYRAKDKGRNRVEGPARMGQYSITGERKEARPRRRIWDAKTRPLRD